MTGKRFSLRGSRHHDDHHLLIVVAGFAKAEAYIEDLVTSHTQGREQILRTRAWIYDNLN